MINYLTDIDYRVKKSAIEGETSEELFNAVVEISNGDNIKYEVHPNGKYLTAVRALSPIFHYPFSYGFIPQTLEEDGDNLDVIIVTPEPLAHLSVVEIRVLGYIHTSDGGVSDTKIVAVPAYSTLRKVSLDKIIAFLKNYKYPKNDGTLVGSFVGNVQEAISIIEEAHDKVKVNAPLPESEKVEDTPIAKRVIPQPIAEAMAALRSQLSCKCSEQVLTAKEPEITPAEEEVITSSKAEEIAATEDAVAPQEALEGNSEDMLVSTVPEAAEHEEVKSKPKDPEWLV